MNTALELARNEKKIGTSLEAKILIKIEDNSIEKLIKDLEMTQICLIAEFGLIQINQKIPDEYLTSYISDTEKIEIWVYKTKYQKCLRCWQHKEEVSSTVDLCKRCIDAISKNNLHD